MGRFYLVLKTVSQIAAISAVVFLFQNCSGSYHEGFNEISQSSTAGLDTTPPDLKVLTPAQNSFTISPYEIRGICENGLSLTLDFKSTNLKTSFICQQSAFSFNIAQLTDGPHRVEITQADASGNTALVDLNFLLDRAAPNVQLSQPAASSVITTTSLDVSGSCEMGSDVVISGSALAAPVSTVCMNNLFQARVVTSATNGVSSLVAEQTDAAGNKGSHSRSLTLNLSLTLPVVKINSPAAMSLTNARALNMSGTCDTGLTVQISGDVTASSTACSNGAFSVTVTLSAGDGLKTLIASQTNSKNEVGQDAKSVTLDTAPPNLTIVSPAAGTKAVEKINLAGVCETGRNVQVSGAGVLAIQQLTCTNSTYQSDVLFSSGLGVKNIIVSQTDLAGNTQTLNRNFERIDIQTQIANGTILYANNCAGCHNPLASSTKHNRTSAQIKASILNYSAMNFLSTLTQAEVDAIATALNTTLNAPPPASTIPTLPLPGSSTAPTSTAKLASNDAFADVPLRRLTRTEIQRNLKYTLNLEPTAAQLALLPEDLVDESVNPFENSSEQQSISLGLVEKYDQFADQYASTLLANTALIRNFAACTPVSASDSSCFNKFAAKAGKLFLRRSMTSTELTRFANLITHSSSENNFYVGPALLVRALLQHPEFLYRVEVGQPLVGTNLRALSSLEVATRLSFLIWGSGPDETLINAAEANQLSTATQRETQALRLLADAKAQTHLHDFHAQWLGYKDVPMPSNLEAAMKDETNQLINKIVFTNNAKWLDLFTATESYVTPSLAAHYGMSVPATPNWVNYTAPRGGGILAHGQFLAQGAKFGDTSPTLRGYRILKRVFCNRFGPIPVGVDPDSPPPGSSGSCKKDLYSMRNNTSCASCHIHTDNIGFGLENYSPSGQWRDVEPNLPTCSIDAKGALGTVLFTGPRELGSLISQNTLAEKCAVRQLFRYSFGRADYANDQATLDALHAQYRLTPGLKSVIQSIVKSPGFIHK